MLRRTLVLCVAVTVLAAVAAAQTGLASISGQVKDASGAVIPGATITVKNIATNVTRTTQSNAEGRYSVANLIPGLYSVRAQFQGFKDLEREKLELRVGDRIALDLDMEVGAAAEQVTVTGEVPLLRTEDVQAGLVIDNKRIQDLPQYNRDVLAFVFLTPNVTGSSQGDLRINGSRTGQIEYFIDGVPVTTGYLHDVPPSVPSREAVGEFEVVTNGMSAEYGRLSGGAVILSTRSGTNEFHGSAYEFFRNDKLNASDWNTNRFGRKKGVFHDNVFGFTFGGPMAIPKVYNGRDKTFFFLNYEGTRRRTGSNIVMTSVPTALEKQGDFSQSLLDGGVPVQIFDPSTSRAEGTRVRRSPFPGNQVPQSRFNALSKIYLGYYPEPNRAPLPNSNNEGNFMTSASTPSNNDRWTGRLDQNWNSSHMTHGMVSKFDSDSSSPRWYSPLQPSGVSFASAGTASLEHTWTMGPTTVMSLRFGAVRSTSKGGQEVEADSSNWGLQREVLNLIGTTTNRVPSISTVSPITGLGGGQISATYETSYTGAVSLQKIWGKHNVKVGYEHRRYYSNLTSGGSFSLATERRVTSEYYDRPTTGHGFAGFLMGISSWGTGLQVAGPASLQPFHGAYVQDDYKVTSKLTLNLGLRWDYEPPRTERFDRQVFWDPDYKWNLTPTAGWSWELNQKEAGITFAAPSWLTNGFYGRAAMMGTQDYPDRTIQKSYKNHFGPRVGLAYQLFRRTVVRAGYGLNWLTMTGDRFLNSAVDNMGFGDAARMMQDGTPDGGLTYPNSFTVPLPNGDGYVPFTRNVTALNASTLGNWFVVPSTLGYPGYEHVLQLNIQHELGSGANTWVTEVSYSGNLGRDLPFFANKHSVFDAYNNLAKPLGLNLNKQVTNPFYGQVPASSTMGGKTNFLGRVLQVHPMWREIWAVNEPLGYSNYHAAYAQVEHRFSQGFSFLANYTLSKALQAGGGIGASGIHNVGSIGNSQGPPQANMAMSEIYGYADWDVRHRMLFNYVVDLPFGRGRKFYSAPQGGAGKVLNQIVGGWSVAGTTTFRSGSPFSLICAGGYCRNYITIGQGKLSRPTFVEPRVAYDNGVSGHSSLEGSSGYSPYFNAAAFRPVVDMEVGGVASTLQGMTAPGFSQWDFALLKNFGLGAESRYLQFRFEAQNLLNHMNAGKPNNTLPDRAFGTITTQAGGPRVIMIAAKIYF